MVSLVVVSHSAALAEAARDLAAQMGGDVRIETAGGGPGNSMGAGIESVESAFERAAGPDGVVFLGDLGSAIIAIKAVLAKHDDEDVARLADAPLVEGLVAAAVTASAGGSIDEVVRAAEDARSSAKT